jgi:hypothetical protein
MTLLRGLLFNSQDWHHAPVPRILPLGSRRGYRNSDTTLTATRNMISSSSWHDLDLGALDAKVRRRLVLEAPSDSPGIPATRWAEAVPEAHSGIH